MKILIVGAAGLLGSELVIQSKERGHQVVVFEGDVSDEQNVFGQVRTAAPDAIINASAISDVRACEENPERARAVHALGAKYLSDSAKGLGIPVLYVSTVSVFSGVGNYKEDDIPNPQNVYNKTKREGEVFTLAYDKGFVARINVIGIHRNGSRGRAFLEWMVDTIKSNKDLTLYTDSRINPLSNITLADMLVQLVEKPPENQIIHLGSSDVVSKADIGDMVLAHFPHYTGTVTKTNQPLESKQPTEMWLNVERAERLFDILPTVSDEVQTILRNHKDRIAS